MKLLMTFYLSMIVIACFPNCMVQKHHGFTIYGTFEGLENGKMLYLIRDLSKDTISAVPIKDGKFFMKGSVAEGTEYFYIIIDSAVSKVRSSELLLINKSLIVECDINNWPKVKLLGSKPQYDFDSLVILWSKGDDLIKEVDKQIYELRRKEASANRRNDKNNMALIQGKYKELNRRKDEIVNARINEVKEFINTRLNSLYIADLIRRMDYAYSLAERKEMYNMLSSKAKRSYFGKLLAKELTMAEKRLKIKLGTIIPDLTVATVDGRKTSILNVAKSSKITLIDFWASWCKPCLDEVPNMAMVYEAFRDEGFNIIGVSLDKDAKQWNKAINQSETRWFHGRDEKAEAQKIFDLTYIPAFALIDSTGKLVAFYGQGSSIASFGPPLRGKQLFNTVKDLLKSPVVDSVVNPVLPLKIGSKVPDISLGYIVNHPILKTAKISDFRGKLVILDFWSTWCSACIKLFPKMEALQRQFRDEIVILPVGFDAYKEGTIETFLKRKKGTNNELRLPCAIQSPKDTLLQSLFPFHGLPHEIWIDKEGYLVGITGEYAVSSGNIQRFLNGEKLEFNVKKVKKTRLNDGESIFLKDQYTFGSAFTGYIDSFSTVTSGKIFYHEDSSSIGYYGINQPIFAYYRLLYSDSIHNISNKRIIVESKRSDFYKDWPDFNSIDNWQFDEYCGRNLFAYEANYPASIGFNKVKSYIIVDLDKYFQIKSRIEKRKVRCLSLVRTSKKDKLQNNERLVEEVNEDGESNLSNYIYIPGNNSTEYLISRLDIKLSTTMPIIDETHYTENINIVLSLRNKTISDIRLQLKRYDLDLIEVEREIDMLVLQDLKML